jgi:hypothetical protein
MQMKNLHALLLCISMIGLNTALAQQSATTPVVITLTDPSGAGFAGTKIRIIPAPDPAPKMETDSKGRLALELKPGGYALFARSPGFKTLVMHFDVREAKEVQTISGVLQVGAPGSPEVSPASSKDDLVFETYPYHAPAAFSLSQIQSMQHITVTIHNSHTNSEETYSGVRLQDLLTKLGAPLGSELRGEALEDYIVASGSDGYHAVLALAEVDSSFHPGEVVVADAMNGKRLDAHSGPLKLVVTEDKRPARWVRNLATIELKSAR